MMKVGIMSDTHDRLECIERAVDIFNREGTDLVVHAGDFVAPFTARLMSKLNCKLIGVFGNNDGEKLGLQRAYSKIGEIHDFAHSFEFGGKKFIVTHYEDVVDSLSKYYDVTIYGHTHKVDVRSDDGRLVINPGECCGYLTDRMTVAILDVNRMEVEIVELK